MPRYVSGNVVTLLRNGTEYFPALEQAIHAARHEIYLETYIFAEDHTGRRIAQALKQAAARGVAVRLMVDGFGSRGFLPESLIQELEASGVQVLIYRPEIGKLNIKRHRLRRLHRKIALVDGLTALLGGINVIDDMNTPNHTPPRLDYAVKIAGPLTLEIQPVVHRLWQLLAWTTFRQRLRAGPLVPAVAQAGGDQVAALLIRDNLRHRNDIEEAYLEAINAARREIIIACAYFFPGLNFRRALMAAAARGVRVILLLQARVEYVWLHHASRALYGSLLAAGIEIVEYYKSFMHAKVAVVDDDWATVGSSNIDPFSFLLSREANVVVRDAGFCAELRKSLLELIGDGARPVALKRWKKRALIKRVAAWIAYGLGRFTMGVLGLPAETKDDQRALH